MPVISRTKCWHDGQEYMRTIKVDSEGQFSMQLPPTATAKLGYGMVTAANRRDVERKFDDALAEFDKLQTVITKVILYDVDIAACISRMDVPGKVPGAEAQMHCIFKQEQISFATGLSLSLKVGVFEKTTIKGTTGRDHVDFKELRSSIPESGTEKIHRLSVDRDGMKEMEWSQEREDFFAKVVFGLEELILMLAKLQRQELAQKFADGKMQMVAPVGAKLLGMPESCQCPAKPGETKRHDGKRYLPSDNPYCPDCGLLTR